MYGYGMYGGGLMYGGDLYSYIFLVLPAVIFAMYAQAKVSGAFNKYSKVFNKKGYTGADLARDMLEKAGVFGVNVERVSGSLTDHYDPRTKVLRLSDAVYSSKSIAALGVAAHETGHAIQDEEEYAFLKLRSLMVPIANIGSNASMPLIILGILMGALSSSSNASTGMFFVQLGIILFAVSVLFTVITLPVEFNASSRAISMLEEYHYLENEEIKPAKKVLSAAAMTYVAATAVAIANLLRLMLLFGGRRNNK